MAKLDKNPFANESTHPDSKAIRNSRRRNSEARDFSKEGGPRIKRSTSDGYMPRGEKVESAGMRDKAKKLVVAKKDPKWAKEKPF